MVLLVLSAGVILGVLGAVSHLLVTRTRARLVVRGRPGLALWSYPISLLIPALFVMAAIAIDRWAVYGSVVGLVVARQIVLETMKEA
ncbi:MAG: hypothetical protein KC731_10050 [Myxococcales bacterium]|nr:hypothetical protein [Myxococcales bacterium]